VVALGILQASGTLPATTHRRASTAYDGIAYWAGTYAPTHSLRVTLRLWYLLMLVLCYAVLCYAMLCYAMMMLS
jgi:hypothetical protein